MRGLISRLLPRSNTSLAVGFLATVSLLGLFAAIWALYEPDLSIHRGMKASQDSVDFRREIAEQLATIAKDLTAPDREGLGDIVLRLSRIVSRLDPRYELSDEDAIPREPRNSSRSGAGDVSLSPDGKQLPLGPDWEGNGRDLVCDEHYLGERHGYPFFDTGFVAKGGCEGEQPLHTVITVLLVLEGDEEREERRLQSILNGVRNYNAQMTVLVAVPRLTERLKKLAEEVGNGVLYEYGEASPGEAWNMLAGYAVTPFVLFARGVTHFHPTHSRLRRQIRVLSGAVLVAGGAARNEEGKWNMGCLQSQIRGYALRYTRGYRISARDCMICDHLEGPFVTRTYLLRTHPFSQVKSKSERRFSYLEAVTFADWFLRLKQAGFLTLGCPDVMYYVLSGTEMNKGPTDHHAAWLWLAVQWELTTVIYPPIPNPIGRNTPKSITFSCGEVGLSCKVSKLAHKGYLVPPCCARQVVAALRAFDQFSSIGGNVNLDPSQGPDVHDLRYELEAGSILGAVKMGSFIPWDIDGDATFESKDFAAYVKGKSWFKERGFSLSSFEDPVPMYKDKPETSIKTKGYFCLNTPDIYIEMWGYHNLSTDINSTPEADSERNDSIGTRPWRSLPEPNMPPTRILLTTVGDPVGVWVRVITNPGLYARNRYGPRFLRHAQSWVYLGLGDSWQSYAASAGDWLRGSQCSRTYHHACLVHYPTDGNLNFYDEDGM
ncbi:uncharacterized protein LOC124168824 [Ischnura elegans]|uniref:uncharacterized protein LOC124168824 n=1 Tax=Ischnura elegans TaxID=197161 RepID=UPI001ED87FC2|nr:uncharacterized protein LOC124168824 [Ischnura elegans]XP_046403108.1 uncharacterized protein LOC124168824 [Ischnura elegans]